MPDLFTIIILVLFSGVGGTIFVWAFVNMGMWLCERSSEKKRRTEQGERLNNAYALQRSRDPSGEDWARYYALRDEHLVQAAVEDAQRAEEIYVNHILERKKIEAAVKKVADVSIVRVIDLK